MDRVIENAYDYQNRWVRRRLDADGDGHTDQRCIFAYDGNQIVLDFWRNNSQNLQIGHLRQRYLWGPAVDQILAEEAVDGGTDDLVQWTLADHLNTVRDIAKYDPGTDMTTVVNHLVYDAVHRAFCETASRRRQPAVRRYGGIVYSFPVSPPAYAGGSKASAARPCDSDAGLQNNLNRWYAAAVGRWLSEDPLVYGGGGFNLYAYCGNDPLNRVDPNGTWYWVNGAGEYCGPYVKLYTGWWCVNPNVWEAAMDAAGGVVNCWWKCEVGTHSTICGKLLMGTEIVSGGLSLPGVRRPKLPGEIVNPALSR